MSADKLSLFWSVLTCASVLSLGPMHLSDFFTCFLFHPTSHFCGVLRRTRNCSAWLKINILPLNWKRLTVELVELGSRASMCIGVLQFVICFVCTSDLFHYATAQHLQWLCISTSRFYCFSMQFLMKDGTLNIQVALACQVLHKNCLNTAVTVANNCAQWKEVKHADALNGKTVCIICCSNYCRVKFGPFIAIRAVHSKKSSGRS